jgi:hypothetical protein
MSRIKVENIRHPDGTDDNITLTDTGLVGIGTTSPSSILDIVTSAGNLEVDALGSTSTKIRHTTTGGILALEGDAGIRFDIDGDNEKVRIDSSGRLLVGTSTSTNVGYSVPAIIQTRFSSTNVAISAVRENGAAIIALGRANGSGSEILDNDDPVGEISFAGADGTDLRTPVARINAAVDGTPGANDMPGRLVFSTTADGASSPTERMRISSGGTIQSFDSSANGLNVRSSSAAGTAANLMVGWYSATNTTNGTYSYIVYSNGNVVNTNNSYGAISDIKFKENIVDANSQWDDLKALQVRNYNFKEGQTHTQIGLIAQEAELVSPGLVTESPDRDEDGNDLGTVTKSVNYSVLYMKAVKALQEAQLRIEQLETQNASFEARLTALEGGQP